MKEKAVKNKILNLKRALTCNAYYPDCQSPPDGALLRIKSQRLLQWVFQSVFRLFTLYLS